MKALLSVLFMLTIAAYVSAQDVKFPVLASGGVVKGAPYSAEAVTESTQFLTDGNKIVRRSVSRLFRDSEGRTRREDMKSQVGVPGAVVDVPQSISITDPVAGLRYELNTKDSTARVSDYRVSFAMPMLTAKPMAKMPDMKPTGKLLTGEMTGQLRCGDLSEADCKKFAEQRKDMTAERQKEMADRQAEREKQAAQRQVEREKMAAEREKMAAERQKMADARQADPLFKGSNGSQSKTESLGIQNIEGVSAEGTRTTTIIPAGTIGNERDVEIVYERWYSKELQVTVMSRRHDPRTGEQVYRLTNITRSDPPANLFTLPSDYTVENHSKFNVAPKAAPVATKKTGNE